MLLRVELDLAKPALPHPHSRFRISSSIINSNALPKEYLLARRQDPSTLSNKRRISRSLAIILTHAFHFPIT